jgi:hypothetical protein
MQNSTPHGHESDLIDRAVAAVRDAPMPQGPTPLVAQRTVSALWAAELEAERKRSRWVIRIAAAIIVGVCAVATGIVLVQRQNYLANKPQPQQQDLPQMVKGQQRSDQREVRFAIASDALPAPTSEISVTGHIYFEGMVPAPRSIDLTAYPQCQNELPGPIFNDSLVVNDDGTLANAVVWIAAGLPADRKYDVPPPAVLDQHYCMFHPHVLAAMVGQGLVVQNVDRLPQNPIATDSMEAPFFNFALGPGGKRQLDPFGKAQTLRLTSDLYPWMQGYIKVFNHPFFDVTHGDGVFTIRDVPPGTYRIAAWQEKLGTIEKQIVVHGGEPLAVDFTFEGK